MRQTIEKPADTLLLLARGTLSVLGNRSQPPGISPSGMPRSPHRWGRQGMAAILAAALTIILMLAPLAHAEDPDCRAAHAAEQGTHAGSETWHAPDTTQHAGETCCGLVCTPALPVQQGSPPLPLLIAVRQQAEHPNALSGTDPPALRRPPRPA